MRVERRNTRAYPSCTEEKLAADLERLRRRGVEAEVVSFDGGHEWTQEFADAAGAFLRKVIPAP